MLSERAELRTADGSPLKLRPHDCAFASEHLNNNTPIQIIQALLGHASVDTVMIYAKLYPPHRVEEYRKAMRGAYIAIHGNDSLRNPTADEWRAFEHSCSMRDMGTHLCVELTRLRGHCLQRTRGGSRSRRGPQIAPLAENVASTNRTDVLHSL